MQILTKKSLAANIGTYFFLAVSKPDSKYFFWVRQLASPSDMICTSLATGIFSNALKVANVIPIYNKKGDKLDCNNYTSSISSI